MNFVSDLHLILVRVILGNPFAIRVCLLWTLSKTAWKSPATASLPSKMSCFSGNLLPLETLFSKEDHISFFGAAWLFRFSRLSCGRKEFMDVRAMIVADE